MANTEHIKLLLYEGPGFGWNGWRKENPQITPDFRGADLSGKNLSGARTHEHGSTVYTMMDLSGADLRESNLSKTDLRGANLTSAQLDDADLTEAFLGEANFADSSLRKTLFSSATLVSANLSKANLENADLGNASLESADLSSANCSRANLCEANLKQAKLFNTNFSDAKLSRAVLIDADIRESNFRNAILDGADLKHARLIDTNFSAADLSQASIFGISAWGLELGGARQRDIIITKPGEPIITVDNLEVGQFIYMLLNNQKIRDVIDTITSKLVLILGRFTSERKPLLDAIREELRHRNYLPVLFDFEKPVSRDITETVSTLVHIARFVIVDITEARSVPQELASIVPHLPSVPVQPMIQVEASEYTMFEHFTKYPWVLEPYRYTTVETVIASLKNDIIDPPEAKMRELLSIKR